jgi:hypothetical protein
MVSWFRVRWSSWTQVVVEGILANWGGGRIGSWYKAFIAALL